MWNDCFVHLDGYGSIPIDTFLVGWTSIYQLFWGSLGTRVLTHPQIHSLFLTYPSCAKSKNQPFPMLISHDDRNCYIEKKTSPRSDASQVILPLPCTAPPYESPRISAWPTPGESWCWSRSRQLWRQIYPRLLWLLYIYMVWLMIVISISVILTIYDVYIYWSAWPLNII